jgi:hypothetical protein
LEATNQKQIADPGIANDHNSHLIGPDNGGIDGVLKRARSRYLIFEVHVEHGQGKAHLSVVGQTGTEAPAAVEDAVGIARSKRGGTYIYDGNWDDFCSGAAKSWQLCAVVGHVPRAEVEVLQVFGHG